MNFFRKLFAGNATEKANAELRHQPRAPNDYASIEPTLRALIYPPQKAEPYADKLIMREDLPGLHTVVMFDLRTTFGNVNPRYLDAWGVSKDDVLRVAVANSVREKTFVRQVEVAPGVSITSIAGDHAWTCAHALAIENHLGLLSPYGALVAVPHCQNVLAYPIRDRNAGVALPIMIKMVHGVLTENPPRPISKDLYWYRDERFDRIATSMMGAAPVQIHAEGSAFLREVAQPLGFA